MTPVRLVLCIIGLCASASACDGDPSPFECGAACDDDARVDATPFECGAGDLVCEGDQACAGTGQGTCSGSPPGPGGCGPNCTQFACAGETVCLCTWFECRDVGACTTCECVVARPGNGSCMCEEADGHFTLSCPGA